MQPNKLWLSKGDVNEEKISSNSWTDHNVFAPGWDHLLVIPEPQHTPTSDFDAALVDLGKFIVPL